MHSVYIADHALLPLPADRLGRPVVRRIPKSKCTFTHNLSGFVIHTFPDYMLETFTEQQTITICTARTSKLVNTHDWPKAKTPTKQASLAELTY